MIKKLLILLFFFPFIVYAQPRRGPIARGGISNVQEEDGSPSVFPWSVKFDNGSLTDNADGTASVDITGLADANYLRRDGTNHMTGSLCFDSDLDSCFSFSGNTLTLQIHGEVKQTWVNVAVADNMLLETGDIALLETGDNILLE